MAHENHRFNFLLRNHSNPTTNSSASLNPIFSESSHGTHYSLFAEFLPRDKNETYVDKFDVGSIRVKLQNFTGPITMGISKILFINIYEEDESRDEFFVDGFSSKRVIELIISIQPMKSCQEKVVEINKSKPLILKQGDLLETQVVKKLISQEYSGAGREKFEDDSLILDEDHMYRDGEEIIITNKEMWTEKAFLLGMESQEFFINNISANKTKEIRESEFAAKRSRKNDPRCKQKSADIYIM